MFYDDDSNPISMLKVLEIIESGNMFHSSTSVGPFEVSTINLLFDHSFGAGRPVHFETLVRDA